MRVVCVWRDNTDYAREVSDWLREFEMRGQEIESLDPDTPEGESFRLAYDVVQYPTVLALDDSGRVLQGWRGTPMPRFDEVSYYTTGGMV